jgi:hypothetical protein
MNINNSNAWLNLFMWKRSKLQCGIVIILNVWALMVLPLASLRIFGIFCVMMLCDFFVNFIGMGGLPKESIALSLL